MDAPGFVPEAINCQSCDAEIGLAGQTAFTNIACPKCRTVTTVPMVFGNLLLVGALGTGGMGTVYKAVDLQLNRYLAVKIVRKKFASDPHFIETFTREARAAAAVSHPNVAQVYAFAQHEGEYYLTMELLEGGSLDDRMTKQGKLPEADVLRIGAQIAAGLRASHQRNLLHRDIKPGNILFNDEGTPKLVDFGLARAQHEADAEQGGVVWGTPYYIAPEKLRGQPEDFRSDMYSLGASLFHALAGRPPFDAKTAREVVAKSASTPAFNLKTYNPTVQDVTAQVIGRMLAKEPAERFESYDALIREFQHAEQVLQAAQADRAIVTASGERVSMRAVVGTLVGLVVVIGLLVFFWVKRSMFGLETEPPPKPVKVTATVSNQPAVVETVDEVDFNEAAPWTMCWTNLVDKLAKQDNQTALNECETIKQLVRSRPYHRQWAFFMEGVTLVAAGRPAEAEPSFKRALGVKVPDKFTPTYLADPLARFMLDTLPAADLARLPAWASGFTKGLTGLKQLNAGKLDEARQTLAEYQQMSVDATQRWAYALQPLAKRIIEDIDRSRTGLANVDREQQAGNLAVALKLLNEGRSRTAIPAFKEQFTQREEGIKRLQDDSDRKKKEAASAEQARQRELAEQARRKADDEKARVAAVDTGPQLALYDFKGAAAKLEAVAGSLTTEAGKAALEQRRLHYRWLLEFKAKLIADIAAKPVPASQLAMRPGVKVDGKLIRATETELAFELPYGEMAGEWRDLLPTTVQKLAGFYAQAAAKTEAPDALARRYAAAALFAKEYKLNPAADWKQATQLSPALQAELGAILGQ